MLSKIPSYFYVCGFFERRLPDKEAMEVGGNSRSVMPLDVLGRSRATMMHITRLPYKKWPGKHKVCIVVGIDPWNF